MASRVAKIYAEVGLDYEPYTRAQKRLLKDATSTTLNIEGAYKKLGIKSAAEFDLMRAKAITAYQQIESSAKSTAKDILRAERAKNAELARIDVMQYGKRTSWLQKLRTGAVGTVTAVSKGVLKLGTMAAGAAIKVGSLVTVLGAAVIGKGITSALSKFSEFEVAMLKMGNVTSENLQIVRNQIVALPAELGTSTELMQGYYQVMSAGITENKEALDMLTVAAKVNKEAGVETGDVVKGLAAVMGTYSDELKTASDAADLLYQMEAKGILQVQELIPYIGNLSNVTNAAGISANEMGAALAQVSAAGQGTSEAVTQLQSLTAALSKKFDLLPESVKKYESAAAAIKKLGFQGVLKEIWDATEGNSSALIKMLGRQEAYMALLQLSKNDFGDYADKLDEMAKKQGSFADAWDRFSSTLKSRWDEFKNIISNQLILIGEKLAPKIKDILEKTSAWVEANEDLIQAKIDEYLGRIGTELKNLQGWIKENIGSWDEFEKKISKDVMPTLNVLWDVIKGISKGFSSIGESIGLSIAQLVSLKEGTISFFEFIKTVAPGTALIQFMGEGSTILPLTEKIAEMTDKMGGFSTNVNNMKTKAVVDFIGNVNGSEMSLSEAAIAAQEAVSRITASSGGTRKGGAGPSISEGAEGYKELSDLYWEAFDQNTDPWIRSFYRRMAQTYFDMYHKALAGDTIPSIIRWDTGTGTRGLPYSGTFYGHRGEIVLNKQESDAMRSGGYLGTPSSKTSNVTKNYHITVAPQFMSGDRAAAAGVAKEIKRELMRLEHRWAT